MATLPKSKLSNQDPIRKPNKNCKIRKTDGAKMKTGTSVTQEQQLADDSVSLNLRLNLISQMRETFTYVNEITEGNRQIMNKLDHFQNNSFKEQDLPKKGEEITDCKCQEMDDDQYPMKTHKHSHCARAIETAEKLSRQLDAFCKCFEEQMCLERQSTSASQSDSVKFYPLSVVFRSGLRRKHIYVKDNSVVLFLSGDINQDRKSCVLQTPNFSNIIHISRSKNLKADKLQQHPGCSTPTTTTILTSATTKETHSANTSTIQMMATSLTTNETTAEVTRTITITGNFKPEGTTSQPCPSAGNITGQLRRKQTNTKDDNRLVSYEAQIQRRAYKPLVKNKNDGGFHTGGRQNRLNGLNEFKGAGHQFVQDKKRAVMREKRDPRKTGNLIKNH